jgi:Zn-dependent oligopeptidase
MDSNYIFQVLAIYLLLFQDEETGKYIVTLEYPHLFPILKKCRVPSTRKTMQTANYSKCHPENTKILEEILQLRHQEATVLGYKNHASYILVIN